MRSRMYASTLPRSNSSSSRTFMVSVMVAPFGRSGYGHRVSGFGFSLSGLLLHDHVAQLAFLDRDHGVARADRGGVVERGPLAVFEEPLAGPGALEGVGLASAVAGGEIQRHPGSVVETPVVEVVVLVHAGDDGRGAHEVLDGEASGRAGADDVDGSRPRRLQVPGDRRGVSEAAYEELARARGGADGLCPVGRYEDDVFAPYHFGRVLTREGAEIVALYARGVLFAAAQEVGGLEPGANLFGFLKGGHRVDGAGTVLQDGEEGRRREEHVYDDDRRSGELGRFDLLPRHQDPEPLQRTPTPISPPEPAPFYR